MFLRSSKALSRNRRISIVIGYECFRKRYRSRGQALVSMTPGRFQMPRSISSRRILWWTMQYNLTSVCLWSRKSPSSESLIPIQSLSCSIFWSINTNLWLLSIVVTDLPKSQWIHKLNHWTESSTTSCLLEQVKNIVISHDENQIPKAWIAMKPILNRTCAVKTNLTPIMIAIFLAHHFYCTPNRIRRYQFPRQSHTLDTLYCSNCVTNNIANAFLHKLKYKFRALTPARKWQNTFAVEQTAR